MKMRDFGEVLDKVVEAAPELKEDLESRVEFWAPEILWYNLSVYINERIKPVSTDKKSIKVYAILCDCTEEEIKKRMEENGD